MAFWFAVCWALVLAAVLYRLFFRSPPSNLEEIPPISNEEISARRLNRLSKPESKLSEQTSETSSITSEPIAKLLSSHKSAPTPRLFTRSREIEPSNASETPSQAFVSQHNQPTTMLRKVLPTTSVQSCAPPTSHALSIDEVTCSFLALTPVFCLDFWT
jgi:hypothetical protein